MKDDVPTVPKLQLRRPNIVMAVLAGVLVGSLFTAVIVGGTDEQEVSSGEGAGANAASGGATGSGGSDVAAGGGAAGTGAAPAPGGGPAASPGGGGAGAPAGGGPAGAASAPAGGGAPGASGQAAASGGGGGAGPAGPNCDLVQTPGVRGVTDTTIKIGVGLADLTALEPVLGEPAKLGPQEEIFEAVLQGLRDEGRLPVCGRDIEAVYMRYQVLEDATSRAVCQSFINDHQVFAIITSFAFQDAACVTQENKTFLLDHGLFISQEDMDQSGGRLFTLHPPVEPSYEIWTSWAIERHLRKPGVKVGVYYNNSEPEPERQAQRHIIDILRRNGIEPVVHTTDTGAEATATGDPNDAGAALRFKREGVTHVMLVNTTLMEDAERQGYRPTYLFKGADVKDSNSGDYVPENADGARGIHWDQVNDASAGVPPTEHANRCIGYAEKAGIARPHPEWAQWNLTLLACDVLGIFTHGLHKAGSDLTTERLVLGLRTLDFWQAYLVGNGGYSETKQWLIRENREAAYFADCKCWKNTGPWEPLFYAGA